MTTEIALKTVLEYAIQQGLPVDGRVIYILGRIRDGMPIRKHHYYDLIFSHAFARAFWGEAKTFMWYADGEAMDTRDISELPSKERQEEEWWNTYEAVDGWQYHLQKMVLQQEPLQYICNSLRRRYERGYKSIGA